MCARAAGGVRGWERLAWRTALEIEQRLPTAGPDIDPIAEDEQRAQPEVLRADAVHLAWHVIFARDLPCTQHDAEPPPPGPVDRASGPAHLDAGGAEGDSQCAALRVVLVLHELSQDVRHGVPLSKLLDQGRADGVPQRRRRNVRAVPTPPDATSRRRLTRDLGAGADVEPCLPTRQSAQLRGSSTRDLGAPFRTLCLGEAAFVDIERLQGRFWRARGKRESSGAARAPQVGQAASETGSSNSVPPVLVTALAHGSDGKHSVRPSEEYAPHSRAEPDPSRGLLRRVRCNVG